MMSAFSPGSTRQKQLESAMTDTPAKTAKLLILLAMTNDYILIKMMQEKYTKYVSVYKLTDRVLGSGSFSEVFLAYARDKRRLAVKVIPRSQISESDLVGFVSEVEILRSLKHDSIVELVDFKKSQHNFYLFLEYCEGGNLAEYIKKRQKLPEPQAIKIFAQIIRGISAMHQFKVMHRDLKPANILLKNGRVKIADFGLACKFSKEQLLRTFAGTPLNMAPQILRGKLYNQSVDIYSAGTVLYEMLYGVMPFRGRDTRTLLQAIEKGRFSQSNTVVSDRIRSLLKEMLKAEPSERIQLNELLDFICNYQNQKKEEKLKQYQQLLASTLDYMGAMGGLLCRFDLEKAEIKRPNEVDLRLYNKLCRKLTVEVGA